MLPSGQHALGQVRGAGAHVAPGAAAARARRRPCGGMRCSAHARQVGDRRADLQQRSGEAEQLGVAPVPGDQPQLRVDHADALAHVLQRRFEHALVEAQVLRGLADDRGDGVEVAPALASRGIEQHARRRRAQHRGQFALDRASVCAGTGPLGRRIAQAMRPRVRAAGSADPASRSVARVEAAPRAPRRSRRTAPASTVASVPANRLAPTARPSRLQPVRPNNAIRRQPVRIRTGPAAATPATIPRDASPHRHQQAPRPTPRTPATMPTDRRARRRLRPPHRERQRRRQRRQRRERHRADVGQRVAAGDQAAVAPTPAA